MNINRATKNLIRLFFLIIIYGFVKPIKAFYTHGILDTPICDVHLQLKQTAKRLKLRNRLLTINKSNIIR